MTIQAPTQEQIRAAWNTIADSYDQHVTPHNAELGEYALKRAGLRAGQRFLDVAAGSGALSIPAARFGADVVATDIAPTMVERLRDRATNDGLSIDARVMDGQSLDLDDATFDIAGSQHGVSLFSDVFAGLSEMARVTKPAGRVFVVAFGSFAKVEFIGRFIGALRAAVPDFEPPSLPTQVSDPDVLHDRLSEAGLKDVSVETITWEQRFESMSQYWNMFTSSNPIARQALSQASDAQVADVRRILEGSFRERSGGELSATLNAEINIGVGTK